MSNNEKTTLLPSEMAERIRNLKVKSSDGSEYDTSEHSVVFYDYEGTVLYSYSPEKFLSLTEMPPNPVHEGLIAQGWNWSLEDAKQYVDENRALTVGQMYTTYDGKTRIYVRIDKTVSDNVLERSMRKAKYGWRDMSHTGTAPGYGTYLPDLDFYNFYLDLSFWYEDDGQERSFETIPKCAIIDWGDGSETTDCWLNGDYGGSTYYYTPVVYHEQQYRYTHQYIIDEHNMLSKDYVITIEVLDSCWRGRLSFSSNDFGENGRLDAGHDRKWTTAWPNTPQFVQKIELGNYMDLATHPDILRPGSYYATSIVLDHGTVPNQVVFESFPFNFATTLSFPSDMLDVDAGGYLYVQLCIGVRDKITYSYIPFNFDVEQMMIEPNTAYSKAYSLEPLSTFNDHDVHSVWRSVDYVATTSFQGHITESKSYRRPDDNRFAFTDRIFEITGELPPTVEISIEYPLEAEMACTVIWIPKNELPSSWDNYLYNLESITLPNGIKSLGSVCFKNCFKLSHVTIPSGITEIPCGTFANDCSLKTLSLPNTISVLDDSAFEGCGGLSDYHILENTTKISDRAFKNFRTLKTVDIPLSVVSIGEEAFSGCVSLSGGEHAFFGQFREVDYISALNTNFVNTIGKSAFKGCETLEDIIFPIAVRYIPDSVCEGCRSLKRVRMQSRVNTIGNRAFYECTSLLTVSYWNTIDEIGDYAFSGCRFANFYDLSGTSERSLPPNLKHIGKRAFEKTSIRHVKIPYAIEELNEGVFSECKLLESIEFMPFKDPHAFDEDEPVFRIETIGAYAFYSTLLTSIAFPDSVTSIGEYALANCWRLESVTLPSNLGIIADHLFESAHLKSIQLPSNVTRIGNYSFCNCGGLSSITISDQVTCIGEGAFKNCYSLSSVTIPNRVTSIGDYAFAADTNRTRMLTNITFMSRIPPVVEGPHTWEGLDNSCTIHVPTGYLVAYKTATNYPDPDVYTYVDDVENNTAEVTGDTLALTGEFSKVDDDDLQITHNRVTVDEETLVFFE